MTTVMCPQDPSKPFTYRARIEMPTAHLANIVATSVNVDPELRPDQVSRHLQVDSNAFIIQLSATDPKSLRTAVSSIYDFIRVSVTAVAQFAP